MHAILKKKCKKIKNKNKKNQNAFQNAFQNDCKRVSRKCGNYKMYLEGNSPYQVVMIMCKCN